MIHLFEIAKESTELAQQLGGVVAGTAITSGLLGYAIKRILYKSKQDQALQDIETMKKEERSHLSIQREKLTREFDTKKNKLSREENEFRAFKQREIDNIEAERRRILSSANELAATKHNQVSKRFEELSDLAFNYRERLDSEHERANKEIQLVLDNSYQFRVKTLLKGLTLKNHAAKLEQIKSEREAYKQLIANREFFRLDDNSDWDGVEKQYRERVAELQAIADEREHQAEIKRQMKEEKKRQDELEKQQREAEEKERQLHEKQRAVEEALATATAEHKEELERQRAELEQEIEDTHKQYERAKSMAQMTKQGHVYVISNIGSFGENVFKVGMTRRLEPMDRVKELGDASVPFEFDVHAMISCDDAPALENALHQALSSSRMNKVNMRKEFFKTDIDTIINLVEENHGTVDYVANPVALQYMQTLDIEAEQEAA